VFETTKKKNLEKNICSKPLAFTLADVRVEMETVHKQGQVDARIEKNHEHSSKLPAVVINWLQVGSRIFLSRSLKTKIFTSFFLAVHLH
jgi:hypothetical protein